MQHFFFFSAVLFLSASCNENKNIRSKYLFSFELKTADGASFHFSELKKNKATVFAFLATDCPLSQNYTLTLNNLNERFAPDSILFVGVIPGNKAEKNEVNDFIKKYKINFKILTDRNLELTSYFGATKTPEVFTADAGGTILYRGAIDNWAGELGEHRAVISEHYLAEALSSIKENRPVKVKQTKATGCFIEKNR